jgi:UPF0716 protein FxsA
MWLALLIAWPIAEIYVAVQVAGAIGIPATILLLILAWPLGIWALRSQGSAAYRRLQVAVAERRTPAREVLDGVLVLLGGLLLMIPGFITDAIGILLLLPPMRALSRPLLLRSLQSRIVVRSTGVGRQPYDVDATARDVDPPRLRP